MKTEYEEIRFDLLKVKNISIEHNFTDEIYELILLVKKD